ncbi:MAG: serine hydroxymethyltransferase [Phenylobacterium sp.]|uniref:serine hydroxymethyltransferase n=1 Tax=Phenylobacterium sp. TaxID=1871053 RepID=UPI00271B7D16|nr:serine hydroxymethyltransferase [Phenylobacterium sp.]MDO8912384.1 serine hydroxymethyltransferase [Phenylobacterium sp.]MDP2008702.1 serine hydroxymethyltransferase [Phenylobacterium sp.]MDP3099596.1 serine hydroxymethyltransferase [Phenylobacterium sp.]MDP3633005.1 serine hydroxymethyltransferase [Phenylobacterium sp.]MDP3867095.1 serine hydroxymethyltransferase [Phenylobacterium sp.]
MTAQAANFIDAFFTAPASESDPAVSSVLTRELKRQQDQIELIASENIVSRAVLEAQGSVLTNKYAEGYPGKRYYGGCEVVDEVEEIAIERAKQLFGCEYVNVQPHSGSQANQAVFMATMSPGDTFMGMDLAAGGHLTHGKSVNQSGKWFRPVAYGVRQQDHMIDYDQAAEVALAEKPKVIIAGGSAYSRAIDFARFREIADSVEALLMVDIAHYAGLVAGGAYPNPFPHAHIVTTTTHKTLRGPRGGMIMTNSKKWAKKIDSAVFPGLQGGPLMHVIAGKAVAFGEALRPEFKQYARQVIDNARALADSLQSAGFKIVSGGTDSHLMLVDLTPKNVSGADAEIALERAGITTNKNGIPFDPLPPMQTSGLRVGTPAGTTRGFGPAEFRQVGTWIGEVLDGVAAGGDNSAVEAKVKAEVLTLTKRFPIYS